MITYVDQNWSNHIRARISLGLHPAPLTFEQSKPPMAGKAITMNTKDEAPDREDRKPKSFFSKLAAMIVHDINVKRAMQEKEAQKWMC